MPSRLGSSIEQRIDGTQPNAATYNVHGLVTKVDADDHLLALAIQDFLPQREGTAGVDTGFSLNWCRKAAAAAPSPGEIPHI